MKAQLLLSLMVAGIVATAQAEETQSATTSTVKASEVQNKDEQKKDIDEEITNARLRATLGSKSKWSMRSSLAYNGSSIEKPFAAIRPNYRAAVGATPGLASLGGSVGINYRATDRDSLYLSTGVSILNPFQGDLSRSEFQDPRGLSGTMNRFDVSGLSLGWSRGYRAMGLQMSTDASLNVTTDQSSIKNYKSLGSADISQTVLADLGESNWQGGVSAVLGTYFYSGKLGNNVAQQGAQQSEYSVGLYPFAEYTFSDKYSFRTVFGYFEYESISATDFASAAVVRQTPYQSMGLGISVTRDIYLYPNVQFVPEDVRADRTNVALSANINL